MSSFPYAKMFECLRFKITVLTSTARLLELVISVLYQISKITINIVCKLNSNTIIISCWSTISNTLSVPYIFDLCVCPCFLIPQLFRLCCTCLYHGYILSLGVLLVFRYSLDTTLLFFRPAIVCSSLDMSSSLPF